MRVQIKIKFTHELNINPVCMKLEMNRNDTVYKNTPFNTTFPGISLNYFQANFVS